MTDTRIQDVDEVRRWLAEGRTYQWMCEEYERQYNIEVNPNVFGNLRRRLGLTRRLVRDDALIPWTVHAEHRWAYPLAMLRAEARRRAGVPLTPDDGRRIGAWLDNLREHDLVVHYDPTTAEGFHYVPRRPGIDVDLVRLPGPDDASPGHAG